ncbi:TPA: hypothetical protein ACQ714_003938, partial [Escherichia coli]
MWELRVGRFLSVYPRWRGELQYPRRTQQMLTVYPRWRGELYRIFTKVLYFVGLSPLTRGTRADAR